MLQTGIFYVGLGASFTDFRLSLQREMMMMMKKIKVLLLLISSVQLSSAVTHSLKFYLTEVTPGKGISEYTFVGQVDEEQYLDYDTDNSRLTLKADWLKKSNDTEYWEMMKQHAAYFHGCLKLVLAHMMDLPNQTAEVHTLQWTCGCELDDDGNKKGFSQLGYDGEDFLSLDQNTGTWITAFPQAGPYQQEWEKTVDASSEKQFVETECIDSIKMYLGYGRSTLERKVRPKVSLFQKDSSSPVVCHATAFFPKSVMISWEKNGEDHYEDVDLSETLPNEDGSFQKRSVLTVSPEELKRNQYTCVVHHEGVEKKLQVSDLLSGGWSVGIMIGVVLAVLFGVLMICAAVFVWKKKKSGLSSDPVLFITAPNTSPTPSPTPSLSSTPSPTPCLCLTTSPTPCLCHTPSPSPSPTPTPSP